MAYFDVLNLSSPWGTTVAIYKNIFKKVIPLVNELIRRPASIRYTVVLRLSVPGGVNIKTFVVSKHNFFVQTCFVCNFLSKLFMSYNDHLVIYYIYL